MATGITNGTVMGDIHERHKMLGVVMHLTFSYDAGLRIEMGKLSS